MKILLIAPASNSHTVKWANMYIKLGQCVHLAYLPEHGPKKHKLDRKVVLHSLKYSNMLGYYLNRTKIKEIVKEVKPDVIHVHYASGYGTLSRIANLHPTVLSVWGSDIYEFPNQSKTKRRVLEKNLKKADFLTSTSFCMKKETQKYTSKHIDVIPFGIDQDKFTKKRVNKDANTLTVGTIKTLEEIYAINNAIDGVAEFIRKYSSIINKKIEYRIYGKGNLKDKLQEQIDKLGMCNNIFLMGEIPNEEVPNILNSLDIALFTSINESFGVSIVEAMACEVPVIASRNEGFIEVLDGGENGILVNGSKSEEIANAIYDLCIDKQQREIYINKGKNKVISNYCWNENVKDMLNLFEKNIYKKEF